jgi:hypothetical protein
VEASRAAGSGQKELGRIGGWLLLPGNERREEKENMWPGISSVLPDKEESRDFLLFPFLFGHMRWMKIPAGLFGQILAFHAILSGCRSEHLQPFGLHAEIRRYLAPEG